MTTPRLTRRQLLHGAGALAVAALGGIGPQLIPDNRRIRWIRSYATKPSGSVRTFHSRPDLRPPTVDVDGASGLDVRLDPGQFLFLGPGPVSLSGSQEYGPLIADRRGEPVWFRPLAPGLEVANFSMWNLHGEPVLAWWEGKVFQTGYGKGEAVILDRSYREVARVQAANGRVMDLHGLCVTPQGTALFTCYPDRVTADLRPIGGPKDGPTLQSVIQEVDISSGRLLFEWRSLDHVPVSDSYEPYQAYRTDYDYLHINSISPTPEGNLLVSGRHTWALYKLERRTGQVMWTLGGKGNQFQLAPGAQFAWQHDARQLPDGSVTVFDNGSNGPIESEKTSRGLVLGVDEPRRTASVNRTLTSPERLVASSMGSVQLLDSGNAVVCFGTAGHTIEFAPNGSPRLDAALPAGTYSFRGSLLGWQSDTRHPPAIAAGPAPHASTKVLFASWNGATELTGWRVDLGATRTGLRTVGFARRRGFETVIPLHPEARYAAVAGVDRHGQELRRSETIAV